MASPDVMRAALSLASTHGCPAAMVPASAKGAVGDNFDNFAEIRTPEPSQLRQLRRI
jgi:hypothetical protein